MSVRRRRPIGGSILAASILLVAACDGEEPYVPTPRSFTPAPETELVGTLAVPPDDGRRVPLELREDLTIGGDGTDPATMLHSLRPLVDVDDDGNIYVTDPGNQRILVYDPEGAYLRTFGRAGPGPGELRPMSISAVAGDTVAVKGLMDPLVQLFDIDGTYRRGVDAPGSTQQVVGLDSGFALLHLRYDETAPQNGVSFLAVDGAIESLVAIPGQPMAWARTAVGPIPVRGLAQASSLARAPGDSVYVASGLDYEVARIGADGHIAWILRVPWIPLPLTREDRDHVADVLEQAEMPLEPDGLDWPDTLPALSHVRSDGAGRLYVFPSTFVARQNPEDDDPRPVPVDVYSPDGQILLHAHTTTSAWAWQTASGPFVYGARTHPQTGEWQIVRYRLDPDEEHLE